jgi:hypothetical protein
MASITFLVPLGGLDLEQWPASSLAKFQVVHWDVFEGSFGEVFSSNWCAALVRATLHFHY